MYSLFIDVPGHLNVMHERPVRAHMNESIG